MFPFGDKDKELLPKGLNVVNNKGETVKPYSWKDRRCMEIQIRSKPSRNNS
jgi:hypothetical protein